MRRRSGGGSIITTEITPHRFLLQQCTTSRRDLSWDRVGIMEGLRLFDVAITKEMDLGAMF